MLRGIVLAEMKRSWDEPVCEGGVFVDGGHDEREVCHPDVLPYTKYGITRRSVGKTCQTY